MAQLRQLVLASASRYRRELLARLPFAFECAAPEIDEAPRAGETPAQSARRLAEEKARALAPRYPDALIVGSDQVASCDGESLGKPGSHANAARQLARLSGRTAQFDTAVCVLDARSGDARSRVVACRVEFRRLTRAQIESYLRLEQPYDCAGSAKAEGLGIALLAKIETEDPTSLIGLPLIALTELLAEAGLPALGR